MCGIVGCLRLTSDADLDRAWVASATQRISLHGPNDDGSYSDRDVALGHKRLASIDLLQGGHQPMRSADGRYWVVFNGEIYNYVELDAELREQGVVLRSSCDAEILLETYARVGQDVAHRLRGMFAPRVAREEKIGPGRTWRPLCRDLESGAAHSHERGAPEGGCGAGEAGFPGPDRLPAKSDADAYDFAGYGRSSCSRSGTRSTSSGPTTRSFCAGRRRRLPADRPGIRKPQQAKGLE